MKKAILSLILVLAFTGSYAQNEDPYAIFGHKSAVIYEESAHDFLYIINTDTCSMIKALALDPGSRRVFLLGKNDYLIQILDLDPVQILTWISVDPKADKYPGLSPYNFCKNNPIIFIDPDGRSANPVFDFDGNLLGADDKGFQGRALFMSKENFTPVMSHDKAVSYDKGIMSLQGMSAIAKFSGSFNNLPNRPDYDGKISLSEANDWYKNGNGQSLYADLSQIDLSGIATKGDNYVGQQKVFNLLFCSGSLEDGLVYGSIKLKRYPQDMVKAYADRYDFDMQSWINPLNWGRNAQTFIGSAIAGNGSPFTINFYGTQKLQPFFPSFR